MKYVEQGFEKGSCPLLHVMLAMHAHVHYQFFLLGSLGIP